ncbi:DUF2800 domain-containing protein [Veillonella caviae]|uniref:DUF2800 domain-containing protein n=1 Tax=Veillonella caviae TaxID=248316 RepID=UPI0023F7BAED|nr:DUF2800 domain-containing protein [Veillonella caviae]
MAKKHALLGASSSARWLVCTPSARLEAMFPDEQSPYAAEGTVAHDLAEAILRHKLEGKKAPKLDDYSTEMVEAVNRYVDICEEKVNEACARSSDAEAMIEARLDFSRWVPEGFGTGDMVIVADGILEVIDLKYGKGVPVSAVENTQMRLYALGAYDVNEFLYDVKSVRMTIVQPRLDSVSTDEMALEELLDWGEEIKPIAQRAWNGQGECTPCNYCNFCKARHTCRALADTCLTAFYKDGGKLNQLLTDREVSDILGMKDLITKWIKGVYDFAYEKALAGEKQWPGFKLVEGTSRRTITDPEAAAQTLLDNGYKEEEIFKPRELEGITNLQKVLGKKGVAEYLEAYIDKPKGKPTLVPESDKRPAINTVESMANEFTDEV